MRGAVLALSLAIAAPAAAQPPPPPAPPKADAPPKDATPPPPPPRPMSMQPGAGQSPGPRRARGAPRRAPRRGRHGALPPRGVPIVSAPTFHRLPNDSTRIALEVDSKVEIVESHPRGRLVYRLKGAFVPERVNRLPLVTGWFSTPVSHAHVEQVGPDVDLVIELREATAPTYKVVETPRGIVLEVDFPRTSTREREPGPPGNESADRARRRRRLGGKDDSRGQRSDHGYADNPPSDSSADKPPPDEPERKNLKAPSHRHRVFGLGSAFGGGVQSVTSVSSTGSTSYGGKITGAVLLPSLELQFFLPKEYSIDLSVPVTNMVLISAISKGYYISADLMFNVNAGSGSTRFVAGPGIGFTTAKFTIFTNLVGSPRTTVTTVRIPGQIGVEWLSKKRNFGFKLLARPWLDIAPSAATNNIGGGVLGVLDFMGYVTSGNDRGRVSEE
jgi:hypothetical protein